MKARQIKKLRKIINTPGYYWRRLRKLTDEDKKLEKFFRSECNPVFHGKEEASMNYKIYKDRIKKLLVMMKWYIKKAGFDE